MQEPKKTTGLAVTPPMGWNTWNTFQTNIDENLIKQTAEAMIENGMRDAGYVYINLDDGWSTKERDSDGNLMPDPERFPGGMNALGEYLHERGFKFGIYNCAGTKTCAGFPGGKDHEFQDAVLYASWGVDYLKYDWCNTEGMNAPEAYAKMRDALQAAGRPVVFSICEWGRSRPWEWASDVGHLWRTTGDIGDFYEGQEKWCFGWKTILDQQVGLEQFAGPDRWNDPDMLVVGLPRMTMPENRAHFSLWCMLAAPLIAGNDVRSMPAEVLNILTNRDAIALNQDPLGRQASRVIVEPTREVWIKPLINDAFGICIFNPDSQRRTIEMDWSQLPALRGRRFGLRDLWRDEDVGDTSNLLRVDLDAHDVVLLRLTANS